ncbi:L,D-transpeptidase family protein [Kineosporia sp. J2-2]|uniref:L,D-transpeptidase family protein n=1 Tax=Kineosporia corallincola TaxID=2835133 RepID=A0ABS5TLT8_9ACTN|nr:Ig-like domain-containing protein [Kineosporia corallincola]MBT0771013.1 L,D-transpeptidase family protein [Kineosporia corallincola]
MSRVAGRGRTRRLGVLAAALAAVIALAGCQSDDSTASGSGDTGSSAETTAAPAAEVTITPGDGTKKVKVAKKVKVSVAAGTISEVNVASATGTKLKGTLSEDKTEWTSKTALKAAMGYTVAVKAANADGVATEATSSFSTLTPDGQVTAYVVPGDGWTVGVGMPVVVEMSDAVAKDKRNGVVDALKVDTGDAEVEGAWQWMSSTQVWWRPKDYWEPGTKVEVTADLTGVEVDDNVWGKKQKSQSDFTIGDEMISTVDVAGHKMTVKKNGKVIRTIPVTTGKASMATRNGIKVIMSRETSHKMNSETIGIDKDDPDYYNLTVKYAMRLTYSGEFIHAAPWSASSQGSANVSHGCTGMTTAEAKWLFNNSKVGDVVVYKNSNRKLEWGNGYTVWNESYSDWKA